MKENMLKGAWLFVIIALFFGCEGETKYVSVDNVPPLSIIRSPQDGAVLKGADYSISGVVTDGTGSGVALVEVSTDGGDTWNDATLSGDTGHEGFSYEWSLSVSGTFNLMSRATDEVGNQESPGSGITVNVDNDPPDITSVAPSNGTKGVSISTTIKAYFSESLDPSTVNTGSFTIIEESGSPVPGQVSYNTSQVAILFTPTALLKYGLKYTATVTGVADAIRNTMLGVYSWSFTTEAGPGGGTGGGPIAGSIIITVLDSSTNQPLPNALVIVGPTGSPFTGWTGSDGRIAFTDTAIVGPTTVTIAKQNFTYITLLEVNASQVTMALDPYNPGAPPSATVNGTILSWDGVPPTNLPSLKIRFAYILGTRGGLIEEDNLTQPNVSTAWGPIPQNWYIDLIKPSFTVTTRIGGIAVYAVAGILDVNTFTFTPYMFGIVRGLNLSNGQSITQNISLSISLDRVLSADIVTPPPTNMVIDVNAASVYGDLGGEGLIDFRSPLALPYTTASTITWTVCEPTGAIAGMPYIVSGAVANFTGQTSLMVARNLTASASISFDSFINISVGTTPTNSGILIGNAFTWTAPAGLSLNLNNLIDTQNTPDGSDDRNFWTIVAPDGLTSFTLPTLPSGTVPNLTASRVFRWELLGTMLTNFDYANFSVDAFDDKASHVSIAGQYFTTP